MESSRNSFEENVGIMIIAINLKRVYSVIGNSLTLHPKMIRESEVLSKKESNILLFGIRVSRKVRLI